MIEVFFDFETYYDKQYSLRKMTPPEYIMDHRFEMIGCAVAIGDGEFKFLNHDEFVTFLGNLDPRKVKAVSHNALFDMCILAWRYGFIPRLMVDTMAMARALLGDKLKTVALAYVGAYLGLPEKGKEVHTALGMTGAMIRAAGFWDAYAAYSCRDGFICRGIYRALIADMPLTELVLNDTIIRCAVEPRFVLNAEVLQEHLLDVQTKKQALLNAIGFTEEQIGTLMSNERFAQLLADLGVDPPRKISQTTMKETWAFSKTDVAFMELEEHDDPMVQAVVAARLGYKSTIEQTRTERFIGLSQVTWPGNNRALMPVPLRYSGAHTHRLSGDWKLNVQNLGRDSKLRYALEAPTGYKVITVDSSQVEARFNATLWRQENLRQQFENKEDVYSSFASDVFGYLVNKKTHPKERFIGKTSVLGLGFGVGWSKFQKTIKLKSKQDIGEEVILSDEEAQRIVNLFRTKYSQIANGWNVLNANIPGLASGATQYQIGPCVFGHKRISLPSGLHLKYHNLRHETHPVYGSGWVYEYSGKTKRLYGAALDENLIQALARCHTMAAAVRLRPILAEFDCWLALQVHDELVYVVADRYVDYVAEFLLEEMRRRPDWMPDVPVEAEIGIGQSYGDAK